jgi:hypothetical protein
MPGIASSVTGSTSPASWQPAASQRTRCRLAQGLAAAGDGGRPRAPKAVKAAGRESGRGWPDDGHGAGPTHANAGGLVIYAKSVRAQVGADADGAEWRAVMHSGCGFLARNWSPPRRRCSSRPSRGRLAAHGGGQSRNRAGSVSPLAPASFGSARATPSVRRKRHSGFYADLPAVDIHAIYCGPGRLVDLTEKRGDLVFDSV